jgi:hypothetical protein
MLVIEYVRGQHGTAVERLTVSRDPALGGPPWSSCNPRPSSAGIVAGCVDGGRGAPDVTAQGVHHWIPTFEH